MPTKRLSADDLKWIKEKAKAVLEIPNRPAAQFSATTVLELLLEIEVLKRQQDVIRGMAGRIKEEIDHLPSHPVFTPGYIPS